MTFEVTIPRLKLDYFFWFFGGPQTTPPPNTHIRMGVGFNDPRGTHLSVLELQDQLLVTVVLRSLNIVNKRWSDAINHLHYDYLKTLQSEKVWYKPVFINE